MGKIGSPIVNDRFLIDEYLSPDLAALANARNHHATHVVFRGLQGTLDQDLMPLIREGNFIFVSNNGRDFLPLYAKEEIHPGLVSIAHEQFGDVMPTGAQSYIGAEARFRAIRRLGACRTSALGGLDAGRRGRLREIDSLVHDDQ